MPARAVNIDGQMSLSLTNEKHVFGVTELNAEVQALFEEEFRGIWVAGEISGCRAAASGHYYFSLKDQQSQIKCALFKGSARFAKFKPQDGLAIIARGNLEVYESRGEYQLIIEWLEPQGAGALQLAFEQLKKKLAAEGLFDTSRKKLLPRFPSRIGLVTSPAGAVIRDMLHVLERRFPGLHIRLFPAQVQGEGSVAQVCQAISYFSRRPWADVLIVARGGGSLEDLWTFNEEAVARAIAASTIPVISAIGHETDFTIADFVADCRAPTPSAAAEIVICTRDSVLEQIETYRAKAVQGLRYRMLVCSRDLQQRGAQRAIALVQRSLTRRAQRLDDLDLQLRRLERRTLDARCKRFEELSRRLAAADLRLRFARIQHRQALLQESLSKSMRTMLWKHKQKHENMRIQLTQLSPLMVLARGYAIVEDRQSRIVRSSNEVSPGQPVKVRLSRGELHATVNAVRDGAP